MAFTFQINNDVKFKHDEKLLAKAEGFRPEIKRKNPSNTYCRSDRRSVEIKRCRCNGK